MYDIPDEDLWQERMVLKEKLVRLIRRRYCDPGQVRMDSPHQVMQVLESIKPDVLKIGFARRFATYKRALLLFTDLDRLAAIVNNKERPVQFIFAGKAHPNDQPGQDLIKRIIEVAAMPQFSGKIIFLQNYDMELARRLVQGVDVWLNTPTRPLEASGTSGEKCVMNGVLQFSVLDGWWVEGYKEGAGWALPMETVFSDPQYQNELDAEMIYNTIEEEIVPKYYDRDADGIPRAWMASVKKCIAEIASNFTTNRMLRDYEVRFYNRLAARKRELSENDFAVAREIVACREDRGRAACPGRRQADLHRTQLPFRAYARPGRTRSGGRGGRTGRGPSRGAGPSRGGHPYRAAQPGAGFGQPGDFHLGLCSRTGRDVRYGAAHFPAESDVAASYGFRTGQVGVK